jgi:hypothetical protein
MENTIFTMALSSVGFLKRIKFSPVDLRSSQHQIALHETLCELGTPIEVANAFIKNVRNIIESETASGKDTRKERDRLGLKHIAYGFYSKTGTTPVTHKRDGDVFDQASDVDYEEEAKKHGDEGARTSPIKPDAIKEPPEEAPTTNDSTAKTPDSDATNQSDDTTPEQDGERPPDTQAEPRSGDSEEARTAADAGSVAAELAVKYVEDLAGDEDED